MAEIFPPRALLALQTSAYIAYHGQNGTPVKSTRIIDRYRLNKRALEPILQTLTRADITHSKQGAQGGYTIAAPDTTTLADVVEPFLTEPQASLLEFSDWRPLLLPAIQQAHADALARLRRTALADIAEQAAKAGISRSDVAPLDFII